MTHTIWNKNKLFKTMIVSLLFIFVFALAGCESGSGLDYNDFSSDHLTSWELAEEQDEAQYLLYYYGENCSYCKTIKDEVLTFAQENNADVKMYFIDAYVVDDYSMNPITDASGQLVEMTGTPTMVVIKNGVTMSVNVGPTIIKSLLEKINEGSYAHID